MTIELPEERCNKCGEMKRDVADRYSFGIPAGRLCTDCCYTYRDNCGEDGGDQGKVETLDEFAYGGYDAVYGEEY